MRRWNESVRLLKLAADATGLQWQFDEAGELLLSATPDELESKAGRLVLERRPARSAGPQLLGQLIPARLPVLRILLSIDPLSLLEDLGHDRLVPTVAIPRGAARIRVPSTAISPT